MARTKKPQTHTLKETIDKAFELGLCSKIVHDIDVNLAEALNIDGLSGSVEQLTSLLAIVHDYFALCSLPQEDIEYVEDFEDELDTILTKNKKHHYDA